jgi:hypothetical protein
MRITHSAFLAALAACAFLGGCGESGQSIGQATTYKQGKYQGKPDTRPYENAPGAYSQGAQWNAGDKTSWENAIKRRQQGQNEYAKAE